MKKEKEKHYWADSWIARLKYRPKYDDDGFLLNPRRTATCLDLDDMPQTRSFFEMLEEADSFWERLREAGTLVGPGGPVHYGGPGSETYDEESQNQSEPLHDGVRRRSRHRNQRRDDGVGLAIGLGIGLGMGD